MKKKPLSIEPTKGELEILSVIWELGPTTVRVVNDTLSKTKDVQYTSTLKQMQVMAEKGLLTRDESQMKHIYSAAQDEEKVKSHFLDRFLDLFYKGSSTRLLVQLLGDKKMSKDDISYIKEQLRKHDKK